MYKKTALKVLLLTGVLFPSQSNHTFGGEVEIKKLIFYLIVRTVVGKLLVV